MKRWAWLLVLPYLVKVSTYSIGWECDKEPLKDKNGKVIGLGGCVDQVKVEYSIGNNFHCLPGKDETCDWIFDVAEALNMARRNRRGPIDQCIETCKSFFPGTKDYCLMECTDRANRK